jgi:formamidopyrimidine-DNA glycosylase
VLVEVDALDRGGADMARLVQPVVHPVDLRVLGSALAQFEPAEELARGLELRERGASDKKIYRVHNRLGEPCPRCGTAIERVDFDEHTIYYCPTCQTEGRILKDRRLSKLLR